MPFLADMDVATTSPLFPDRAPAGQHGSIGQQNRLTFRNGRSIALERQPGANADGYTEPVLPSAAPTVRENPPMCTPQPENAAQHFERASSIDIYRSQSPQQ